MTDDIKNKAVKMEVMQAFVQPLLNKGIVNYATCSTAAATVKKQVTLGTTFALTDGAMLAVKFSNGISVASSTLEVKHTPLGGTQTTEQAKAIYYQGGALASGLVKAGDTILLRYNGTQFDVLGSLPDGELIHYASDTAGASIAGNTASGAYNRTQWVGTTSGVDSLYTGLVIAYKVPIAGVKYGVSLNINSLGEHPVVMNANTTISTAYPVGAVLKLIYDADQTATMYVSNTSTSFTGCWKLENYDSNTDTFIRVYKQLTNNATWNTDYPLIASRSLSSAIVETDSKYAAVYGLIGKNDVTPTVNPITGAVKVKELYIDSAKIESKEAEASGADVSLVTTGEKATWNGKQNALTNPVTRNGSTVLTPDKVVLGAGTTQVKPSTYGITTTSPSSSSDDTTLPTSKAVWTAITTALGASDAMVFKGTLGTGGTVTAVPTTNVTKGDTYKVITAGTWAGSTCKVGDLLIALTTGASVAANTTNWAYVPSGDETVTTIATSSSPNVNGNAQSGAVTLGTVVTKAVETALTNVDSAVPTSKAVKSFVEGKGYGTYSKPSGGIPKTDLANGVQTSLGLAESSIQTITAVAGENIDSVGTPTVTASTSNGATTLTFDYLKGATGATGQNGTNGTSAAWFTGTAVTGTSTSAKTFSVSGSKAGDMYLNTSTSNVYSAVAANSWVYKCNIKGATGSNGTNGTTPSITASASVDANTGTPSVTVTKDGTDAAPSFAFAFKNLKGAPGQNATTTALASTSSNGLLRQLESASVATQTKSTKFLREDGNWAAPSYPTTAAEVGITASVVSVNGDDDASNACTITTAADDRKSQTVIYRNSGSSDVTITLPSTGIYVLPNGEDTVTCPAGGYCEVNFLNVTTNGTPAVFVRAL